MRVQRIVIQTHHITSRKKVNLITKAAKRLSCSVLLKTGRSPGFMVAESEGGGAWEWGEIVRNLRYKDFKILKREELPGARLGVVVPAGSVREVESVQDVKALLGKCGDAELWEWWCRSRSWGLVSLDAAKGGGSDDDGEGGKR